MNNYRAKQTVYVLDAVNDVLVAGANKHFDAIYCTTTGPVKIKAGGGFQYLAAVADGSDNTNTTFINPDTGKAFVAGDNPAGAGFYEGDGSQYVTINMTAGDIINTHLTSIKIDAGQAWRGQVWRY